MFNSNQYNEPLDDRASMGNWWCYVPKGEKPPVALNGGVSFSSGELTQASYVNPETFVCDRCNECDELNDLVLLSIGVPDLHNRYEYTTHHLCADCYEELLTWIAQGKLDNVINKRLEDDDELWGQDY